MTIHKKITTLGFAAATAFLTTAPISLQAQALDVTCDASAGGSSWATDLCDDADMTEVESAVNQNANEIDANTAAASNAQNTANAAQTAANNAQTAADAAQAAADDAQDTADDAAAAAANAQTTADDAQTAADNAQAAADNAQATADGAVAVNNAQQSEIDANTSGVANNANNIQTNTNAIATNTTNIQSNTAAIATNAARIQTNSDDIAANAADIVDLQDGLSDLRNDLNKGLAMSNAMEVFAPDPGSNFRLNIGTGFHEGEAAFAITGAGRVGAMADTIVYLGVAAAEGTAGGKAGVSFQW